MRKSMYLVMSVATAAAFTGMVMLKSSLSVAQQAPAAVEEKRAADNDPAPFNPQMSALMNMIIQPRHAKLGLAGQVENWPLAGYALKELRQGFVVTARAVPRWKGLPVPDLFEAAVSQPLAVLDFAIKAQEPRQFGEGYAKLTAGCNACHATTDHSFILIKPPDSAAAFPNQDFQPKR